MTDPKTRAQTCSNCLAEGLGGPFCPHCGAPTFTASSELVHAAEAIVVASSSPSPGRAWLTDNAIVQSLNASVFGGLFAGWIAIGASLGAAMTAAFTFCLIVPVLGWFIGLPIVFCLAMTAGMMWVCGLFVLLVAWMSTAAAMAAISFGYRLLESRT